LLQKIIRLQLTTRQLQIEAAKEIMERELMKDLEKRREERILQEKYREVGYCSELGICGLGVLSVLMEETKSPHLGSAFQHYYFITQISTAL
jgi:hypothetical protein